MCAFSNHKHNRKNERVRKEKSKKEMKKRKMENIEGKAKTNTSFNHRCVQAFPIVFV